MAISKKTYYFLYQLSYYLLQWSLVYLLVLFFLEDLKPFLVRSHFSPHWIIGVVVVAVALVLWFAPYGHKMSKQKNHSITQFDRWLLGIMGLIAAILVFQQIRQWSYVLALLVALMVFSIVKFLTVFLVTGERPPSIKKIIHGSQLLLMKDVPDREVD